MITVKIIFKSRGIRVERKGSFQSKDRPPEKTAVDWIQEIKKEMDVDEVIEIIVDGDRYITGEFNEILKAPLD